MDFNLYDQGCGLVGSIPAELASLAKLIKLDLSFNHLTGLVPELPWNQYTRGCSLQGFNNSAYHPSNNYTCPLPTNSAGCLNGPPTCH
jgi:hypothetical protein